MCDKTLQRRIKMLVRILAVAVPLIVGAVFYLVFDPHTALSIRFYRTFPILYRPELFTAWTGCSVFRFFRNYLCDFCWAFSMEGCVFPFWKCNRRGLICSVCLSIMASVLIESSQLMHAVTGTFDPADILVEAVAILMAGFIHFCLGGKSK